MRFISWNVNGLRSCVQKGFMDFFNGIDADFVCLQETKLQPEQISLDTPGYEQYEDFYLVTCYTPNSQDGLKRLDYRLDWERDLRLYLMKLDAQKPVILCGDLNVAHEEIDLKNPKSNHFSAGFSDEERGAMTELLDSGFTDTFRWLYPDLTGAYSWWSFRSAARSRNAGWRIDYFIVSDRLRDNISKAYICSEILGSDHCPVGLDLTW